MHYRQLGSTGLSVSEVGLGTWQIGSDWGDVSDVEGRTAVTAALDAGVSFFDTADVYGDGRSEQVIQEILEGKQHNPIIATKAGRRLEPHVGERYTAENLRRFVDRSRENLGVDTVDLLQLHCPPNEVYYRPSVFEALETLAEEDRISHYGVSVEKVEQGLKAIEYPGVETIQIIFNPFRQRPAELFFEIAKRRDVGVIVRVPLASGLLTGTFDIETEFPTNDHRNFNRDGSAFDRGETFAGLPYERALKAVDELAVHVPKEMSMAQLALRWVLDHDAVSTVIPGSTTPSHIRDNAETSEMSSLSHEVHGAIRDIYEEHVYDDVHHQW
jgi:aryl-alcohol dehydrogenase-like predicted oxidoreductase